MMIATSGLGSSISYNRIISATSSNNVVSSDSKTYRHATLPSSKRLRGLFITDKDNLVALIWDNFTLKTDVAILNLAALSITYKPSLPLISNMFTAVFYSASVYYTTSTDTKFYKNYLNTNYESLNGGFNQGIVYSSDMSLNSCYTM